MTFTKRLRAPIMRGEITCRIRIWRRPHVKVGGHYGLGEGFIEVTSIRRITMVDITPELARRSGFLGVLHPQRDSLVPLRQGFHMKQVVHDSLRHTCGGRVTPIAPLSV
jgi:hypothetical protein